MEKSNRFEFYLPSRDIDDIADINQISDNFRKIDEKVLMNEDVDQVYSDESSRPQSGVAVKMALDEKKSLESADSVNGKAGVVEVTPEGAFLKTFKYSSEYGVITSFLRVLTEQEVVEIGNEVLDGVVSSIKLRGVATPSQNDFTDAVNVEYAQRFSNAIVDSKSGEVVKLSDVSKITHHLKVKAEAIPSYELYQYLFTDIKCQEILMEGEQEVEAQGYVEILNPIKFASMSQKKGIPIEYGNEYNFVINCNYDAPSDSVVNSIYYNGNPLVLSVSTEILKNEWGINFLYVSANVIDTYAKISVFRSKDISKINLYARGKNFYDNSMSEKDKDTTATGYSKFKIELPNGTYTWSLKENKFLGSGIYLAVTDDKNYNGTTPESGSFISWIGHSAAESLNVLSRTFTVTKGVIYLAAGMPSASYMITLFEYLKNFQIELGDIPTEYESYKQPVVYPINADGTVDDVISIYPTTTLYADTEGIMLNSVEYAVDTKKYIDNKFAELGAMIVNS